jgi:hypothetical protein
MNGLKQIYDRTRVHDGKYCDIIYEEILYTRKLKEANGSNLEDH